MKRALGALLVIAILATSCSSEPETETTLPPATLESVDGSAVARLTLSAQAARRLGIATAQVTTSGDVPYSSVVYDADGDTWAYVNESHLVYRRHPITLDRIEGDIAYLSDGPAAGTPVVVVGTAELSGFENGVGG